MCFTCYVLMTVCLQCVYVYALNPTNIFPSTHTLIHYTTDFKQFLTCFDVCYINFRGIKLEH
jgi:hypothetical protein